MGKRFTATEKWDKLWFQKLPPRLKCFWWYLMDRCDQAGVWEINYPMASFMVGEEITENDVAEFGERLELLGDDKLWIKGFIEFQQGTLSHNCNAHKPIIKLLEKHCISDRVPEPIANPTPTLSVPLAKGTSNSSSNSRGTKGAKGVRKTVQAIPINWSPTETHREYADTHGINIEAAEEVFTGWAIAAGKTYVDWNMCFSNALRDWLPEKVAKMPVRRGQTYSAGGAKMEGVKP